MSVSDGKQRAGELPGGCHTAQLTALGGAQAVALGRELRRRYGSLLPCASPGACAGLLQVRSSNTQRTVATAAGVLSGLFPGAEARSPAAAPAPVRVGADDTEWLFPNYAACARLRQLWQAQAPGKKAGAEHAAFRARWAAQLASLRSALAGHEEGLAAVEHPWGCVELMDVCISRAAHGLPPLGGITPSHTASLGDIAAAVVGDALTARSGDALRLAVGRLVRELDGHLDAAASRAPVPAMGLYAAHDTTVLPLLLALQRGLPADRQAAAAWPPYASAVALELWTPAKETPHGGAQVRVLFNGAVLPMACAAEGNGTCTLAAFRKMLAPFLKGDLAADCAAAA